LPGIRELAQIYSASTGTIQHAVGILHAEGVISARTRSGCYVNAQSHPLTAIAPSETERNLVGFVMNKQSVLSMKVLSGIDTCCREYGYGVMTATVGSHVQDEEAQVLRVIETGCKGLVLKPHAHLAVAGQADYLKTSQFPIPIVICDLAMPFHPFSQVLFDNFKAGYDMTRYLTGKGHARIAFGGLNSQKALMPWRSLTDRYRGYVQALVSAGVPLHENDGIVASWDRWPLDHEWCELWLNAWKQTSERPSAILAMEDGVAFDLIRTALALGIDVPGDLEICGFDDLPIRQSSPVPFASTQADWELAGRVCVEILLQHVRQEIVNPVVYMLPTTLVGPDSRPPIDMLSAE